MSKIRWIHFSDLHLGDDCAVETRMMRKQLTSYISNLNRVFDYVFCTGDIKQFNAAYNSSCSDYLKKLCEVAHTDLNNLFLVPGNHDVDISSPGRENIINKLTDWNSTNYSSEDGNISDSDMAVLKGSENSFVRFVADLLGEDRASYYEAPHFVIKTDYFNLLHIDSTLTYYSKSHERDFIVGTRAFMDALDQCDESKPTILLTHYSFDFLSQKERNEIAKLLSVYNVQLWIAGHEHEHLIRRQRDCFYECQCGNLVLQNGAESCFLTGEYDTDTGEGYIEVHAWYTAAGWALYPFARTGTEDNTRYPFVLRLPGDNRSSDVSIELANAREACSQLAEKGRLFSGVDVNETILTDLECSLGVYLNDGETTPLEITLQTLWRNKDKFPEESCNGLILGDGGMGKSTMMYHECNKLLTSGHLAVYVSLQARENADYESIHKYVLRCLYKSADDRANNQFALLASTRHRQPDLTIFVDGFNELTGSGAQKYSSEIKRLAQYPGIQIIVSSRLDFLREFGLNHFMMIRTCDLREQQINGLFSENEWSNIQAHKNLRILLKNPMMALLYSTTCPIVEANKELDYIDWIIPTTNAADLLHNYYLSQVAVLLNRDTVNPNLLFDYYAVITLVLPKLAFLLEKKSVTVMKEDDFDRTLSGIVSEAQSRIEAGALSRPLRKISRKYRMHNLAVDQDRVYEVLLFELCLLKNSSDSVAFTHQIFRDYLAAVYLFDSLKQDGTGQELWHTEKIHKGVTAYLRHMSTTEPWGNEGWVNPILEPYKNVDVAESDNFISNIIDCWLCEGVEERDLSGLDLRNISLADQLKGRFQGTINIDNARVTKRTFLNEKRHDKIIDIAFSHDRRTMAAISSNGVVSVTNIYTQSQMIIGEMEHTNDAKLGFDVSDVLIMKNDFRTVKWATIAYDVVESGIWDDVVHFNQITEEICTKREILKQRLKESGLIGCCVRSSEDGRLLAIGFASGFIQIWDVVTQECIAHLSLSDSQITTVSFTSDGRMAALGSGGKIVQIWDISRRKLLRTICFENRVNKVRFPENTHLLECHFSDGTYQRIDIDTEVYSDSMRAQGIPFVSKQLIRRLKREDVALIESEPRGNAIVLLENGQVYTWCEKEKKLLSCPGHLSKVTAVAICSADNRFAASYSPERYRATRNDKKRRDALDGQKLVRVRIVRTGQCQWRLPTKGRSIRKLQFFTANRIVLAGFAENGDILLWELINEIVYGRERGRWETVEIVRYNQSEPIECAIPHDKKTFISAYSDGSIVVRSYKQRCSDESVIKTFPGIDASVFRWSTLQCDDRGVINTLGYYKN